jgi:hypothetical protein
MVERGEECVDVADDVRLARTGASDLEQVVGRTRYETGSRLDDDARLVG